MAYQNDNRGGGGYSNRGGGQNIPRRFITIGALWADADKNGNWMAKGSLNSRVLSDTPWMLDLLHNPKCKLSVVTNTFKDKETAPDIQLTISIPEDELPQEYWDWEEARQAERPGGSQGGYAGRSSSPPPAPGGGYRNTGGAPARPQARGYERPAPARGGDRPAPSRGAYPERGAPARGRMVRQEDPVDPDYVDPFAEENG